LLEQCRGEGRGIFVFAALSEVKTTRYSCNQRQGMKNLGWRQWLLVLALVLVVAATGLFAVRTVRRAGYWRQHRDETIRPWMNLGYIAHSYRVPPWVLHQALGLPLKPDRRPIRDIAREQGRSVDEVIAILQNAIVHSRPPYPPPSAAPPPELRDHGPPKGTQGEPQPASSQPVRGQAPGPSASPTQGRSP
jgi:hypothetical protein